MGQNVLRPDVFICSKLIVAGSAIMSKGVNEVSVKNMCSMAPGIKNKPTATRISKDGAKIAKAIHCLLAMITTTPPINSAPIPVLLPIRIVDMAMNAIAATTYLSLRHAHRAIHITPIMAKWSLRPAPDHTTPILAIPQQ